MTEYGKKIKIRLIELEKNQTWLIEEVKKETGLYFDDSYLYKIIHGKVATPSVVGAINKILNLKA